jgi:hypothetical protein
VTVLFVIVLVAGKVETVVVVETEAVLLAVLVVLPVLTMIVVLLVLLTLRMLEVVVVTVVLATGPLVVDALVLIAAVLLALFPVPIHPAEPAMHDENDATLGPTNQSSPNCPLYGSRYEEALEGRWAMPEIATIGLGLVGPALLTILISAH